MKTEEELYKHIQKLRKEIKSLRILTWLLIEAKGGEIIVPDYLYEIADKGFTVTSIRDEKNLNSIWKTKPYNQD